MVGVGRCDEPIDAANGLNPPGMLFIICILMNCSSCCCRSIMASRADSSPGMLADMNLAWLFAAAFFFLASAAFFFSFSFHSESSFEYRAFSFEATSSNSFLSSAASSFHLAPMIRAMSANPIFPCVLRWTRFWPFSKLGGAASPSIDARSFLKKRLYADSGRVGLSLGFFHFFRVLRFLGVVVADFSSPPIDADAAADGSAFTKADEDLSSSSSPSTPSSSFPSSRSSSRGSFSSSSSFSSSRGSLSFFLLAAGFFRSTTPLSPLLRLLLLLFPGGAFFKSPDASPGRFPPPELTIRFGRSPDDDAFAPMKGACDVSTSSLGGAIFIFPSSSSSLC
mmetsp:Transcript_16891/g.40882  ORF Transcript_16891/g.40882 Transcript_16891/m.40882 type:complete len:337 (-) Transcript_16891:433-1443(-)